MITEFQIKHWDPTPNVKVLRPYNWTDNSAWLLKYPATFPSFARV